jgi:hypothetical protein
MKERIRDLEKQSGIDVYSLGLDRAKWESKLEKFAQLIVRECANVVDSYYRDGMGNVIKEHFGVEEQNGWVCPRCGVDRAKVSCPSGYSAAITGKCPMFGVAQGVEE